MRHVTAIFYASALFATSLASAEEPAAEDKDVAEIVVLGQGESRQVQSFTGEQLDQLPAGTSPLKALDKLPGVNFQSADPYGSYEWSVALSVRGFNQSQLGFTLDGVPLGDMSYANHNGLHISRAIPSEDIGRVTLSQGTGALTTASTSNLGGTVEFFSADPQEEFGARLTQMVGSDSARRTVATLETGEIGPGTRGYLTVVDANTEKWRGAGDQKQRMYNLKVVQPIGEGKLTGYYNYSDRAEFDYQDLSFDIIERRGYNWDNWYPDWNSAVAAAAACNAAGQSDAVLCDDAYWNAAGLRKDDLGYLAFEAPLNDVLSFKTTAYLHKNEGQGLWGTPYVPTPGGAPLSIRTTEYDVDRKGALASLDWQAGAHQIGASVWFETIDFNNARRFYGEPNIAAPTRSFDEFQRNPMQTQWEYQFDTDTVMLSLQDTWSLTDDLRLSFGFKSLNSESSVETIVGELKTGSIETDEPFLPQVGLNWALRENQEVFAAAAKNVRAFIASNGGGPFSTTAAGFNAIRDTIEPETATTIEAGWRFHSGGFEGLLTAYRVSFDDRQLSLSQGPGIVGNPSVLVNVGSVTTNGIEAALNWKPVRNLSWFTSASWNDSEYDDDYSTVAGNGAVTVVPVSGKQVVNAPEVLLKSELTYDNSTFFAHLDANFTDERYYTYLNQGSVPSYTLLNAGLGYRFTSLGFVEELTAQIDITNITDKEYISTIGTNGFGNADPNGTMQTLLTGAPRQAFFAVKARF